MARRPGPAKWYTVYLRKTDEIVAFGTAEECARQLGFSGISSFKSCVSKSMDEKNTKYKRYEFIIDDTPYDEE